MACSLVTLDRSSHAGLALLALAAAPLLSAACSARHPPSAEGAPRPEAWGISSYSVQAEPVSARAKLPASQELLAPRPRETNALPAYPQGPLTARFGAAAVGVRIIIGADGHVIQILDSPLVASTPGPFAADFRAAVVEAVTGWRFLPATLRRLEDGPDNDRDGKPDWKKVVESGEIPVYLDLRFDFEIAEGRGVVRSGSARRESP